MKITIVLPAYNEALTIDGVIRKFHSELPQANFVVIDNNSTDNTHYIANTTLIDLNASGIVLTEKRQGKGSAVRRAFLEIDSDIYVLCDADQTYPAEFIHNLIEPIQNNAADMVVGDRHSNGSYQFENSRRFHHLGNKLVTFLVNKFFNANLNDIMSGYRALSRGFVKNYPILVDGFELETDMTLHAQDKRLRIVELPINYRERPLGSYSKLNTFSDGAKVIFTILNILRFYKPLFFFSCISLFFFIFGLVVSIPVLKDWISYQYIYHIPSAILATGLELLAAISLGIGLILNSISFDHKIKFELALMNR